jgi:NAD(P)H-quinone oxidoreductase subunit 4L
MENRNTLQSTPVVIGYMVFTVVLVALYVSGTWAAQLTSMGLSDWGDYWGFVTIAVLGAIALKLGGSPAWILSIGTWGAFVVLSIREEPLLRYLTLSAALFAIGMYGMVSSRNAVRVLMSIELMLNAVNINLVAFARYVDPALVKGQIFAIFILTVAAAEAAVGLAIVLAIYRNMATVDMERFNLLKW